MGYSMDFEEHLDCLRRACLRDSEAWFPEVHATPEKFLLHSIMGMAFEAGEAGDVVKKAHRHADMFANLDRTKLGAELADSFIYMLHVCTAAGINLAAEVPKKRAVNLRRFGGKV